MSKRNSFKKGNDYGLSPGKLRSMETIIQIFINTKENNILEITDRNGIKIASIYLKFFFFTR